ncbi:3'-5' exonuclease [Paenibacillus aquistagni]|uniref:3'-5' exonuclease n=1 Tax=Paenibacillus aquistagni TaxID=1852522 RepID=UPI000B5079EB|nr:3'-5' exonuclease [Paenibacillus aquistagni]
MLAIIYDLEMTVNRKKGEPSEIIEIGAVKVRTLNGQPEIVDKYQAFVRPVYTAKLSADTENFTGIKQADVAQASTLQDVLDSFIAWIDAEEYALLSWGEDDKVQFVKECRDKKIPLYWLMNYTNLQKQVTKLMERGKNQQIGLKPALEALQIPFVGDHHRALDDAYNTALIYLHFEDRIQLQRNETSDYEQYKSELIYQDDAETEDERLSKSPFAALANMNLPNRN